MKIGIDLDGVVIDSENTLRVYEEVFDIEEVGGNNIIDKEEPYFQQRYNWDEEIQDKFWKNCVLKASIDSNLMPGFKLVYNLLKDNNEFIVITARGGKIPELIDDAKEKFKKNNIKFDKYYWNIHNKAEICKKENIDIMIDDSVTNCVDIASNGIKTLYFKATDLKILKETEYLKQVTNWGEIYRIIKENNI